MKITILIDNLTQDKLKPEWGLAAYIEYEGGKYLLDSGASGKFAKNAEALGIDLSAVDYAVLSHAHFDHSNGMAAFFEKNSGANFFLRQESKENCYGKKWIFSKYIGIRRGYLERFAERITFVSGDTELAPGVWLIPHKTPNLEVLGKKSGLYVKTDGTLCPDCFDHEQSLVFDTPKGLVILNSCSHGGADNIIREVGETFHDRSIHALIGGLHLFESTDAEVRAVAADIGKTGIELICTGHCTGKKAYKILREELGSGVMQIRTGTVIEI